MRIGAAPSSLAGHMGFHGPIKGPIVYSVKRAAGAFADAVREFKRDKKGKFARKSIHAIKGGSKRKKSSKV